MSKFSWALPAMILSLLFISCTVAEEPGEVTDDLTVTDTTGGSDDDTTASATCGDSITNGADVCDGDAVDCTTLGDFTGGFASCKTNCTGYDTTNCVKETTGDDTAVTDSDTPGATDDGTVATDEDPGVFDK
ncbi:MAG TPA: hypothetical protein PLV42_06200, partial [bacterium]|nr:hypothetical protein [bacterium]